MRAVFTVNAGSSSLKCAAYVLPQIERIFHAHIRAVGSPACVVEVGGYKAVAAPSMSQADALDTALSRFRANFPDVTLAACSHRIVHGGAAHAEPIVIDDATLADLDGLSALAPLHQPHNLTGVRALQRTAPGIPQVACFDTAFHRGHPRVAEVYALPREVTESGVRRYGFHGLSYAYIATTLREVDPILAAGEVVVCHLGSGASLCAMRDGKSIDTTMGFSALDGLPMSTRTGQLDPGVVIHLLREGRSIDMVERMLYRESGLKGLSGLSGDMRDLLASDTPEARFAIEYFCYRVAREIGALAISLDGLDGVVFTGGIGENQPEIRANVAARLGSLGAKVDAAANQAGERRFEASTSEIGLLRIPTDEEIMLARDAASLVG